MISLPPVRNKLSNHAWIWSYNFIVGLSSFGGNQCGKFNLVHVPLDVSFKEE